MGTATITQSSAGAGKHKAYGIGGDIKLKSVSIALSSSYAEGGDSCDLDQYFASEVFGVAFENPSGYTLQYDITNKKLKVYRFQPAAVGAETVTMTDDDSAASNGTAVNVVADNTFFAHFESTTAGNADSTFETDEGSIALVTDNDSPGGVAMYFDEDGTAGSRFLCVSPTGADLYVPLSSGKLFKVTHDASASSNGVQVYFDDDGATVDLRLLFVSPTDADGSDTTPTGEVETGTDLSAITVKALAWGK